MLSDEEKKAWDRLVMMKTFICYDSDDDYENSQALLDIEAIDTILNLIEKQSKEIEELKEENKTLKNLQNDTNRLYTEMIERKNYFERELQKLEDKIKAKIEEINKDFKEYENGQEWEIQDEIRGQIEVLQSLLEKE